MRNIIGNSVKIPSEVVAMSADLAGVEEFCVNRHKTLSLAGVGTSPVFSSLGYSVISFNKEHQNIRHTMGEKGKEVTGRCSFQPDMDCCELEDNDKELQGVDVDIPMGTRPK